MARFVVGHFLALLLICVCEAIPFVSAAKCTGLPPRLARGLWNPACQLNSQAGTVCSAVCITGCARCSPIVCILFTQRCFGFDRCQRSVPCVGLASIGMTTDGNCCCCCVSGVQQLQRNVHRHNLIPHQNQPAWRTASGARLLLNAQEEVGRLIS